MHCTILFCTCRNSVGYTSGSKNISDAAQYKLQYASCNLTMCLAILLTGTVALLKNHRNSVLLQFSSTKLRNETILSFACYSPDGYFSGHIVA